MTPVDASRRERKKNETRERIAAAAFRLFREKGIDATTIDEIAATADVAKGTFFNYYPHKEAVLAHFAANEIEAIERGAVDLTGGSTSARDGLLQIFAGGAASHEQERDLWRVTVFEMMRHKTPAFLDIRTRIRHVIQRLLVTGQERGELRSDFDAACAANVLHAVFISTTLTWLHCPDEYDLGSEMRQRLDLVFRGLDDRAPAPDRSDSRRRGRP